MLKVSFIFKLGTSSPVRRQPIKSTGSLAPPTSRPGSGSPSSKQDISGGESEGGDQTTSQGDDASRRESIKQNVRRRLSSSSKKSQKSGAVDTTHDAMGSKWPKAMWDNTESKRIKISNIRKNNIDICRDMEHFPLMPGCDHI